jgi:hypothetical protein
MFMRCDRTCLIVRNDVPHRRQRRQHHIERILEETSGI